jgi:hypothetical protein
VEKALTGSYTSLRVGFFAQNLADAYRQDIVEEDRLYLPAGSGRIAFVDLYDVAEVAADIFCRPAPHLGQAYTLTGSEAISFYEVAEILTSRLERKITYEPATAVGYIDHLRRRSRPWTQCLVQTVLHLGIRFGQAAQTDSTLESLLGRSSRKLEDYVMNNRAIWTLSAIP